jgi:hypothetical protein
MDPKKIKMNVGDYKIVHEGKKYSSQKKFLFFLFNFHKLFFEHATLQQNNTYEFFFLTFINIF